MSSRPEGSSGRVPLAARDARAPVERSPRAEEALRARVDVRARVVVEKHAPRAEMRARQHCAARALGERRARAGFYKCWVLPGPFCSVLCLIQNPAMPPPDPKPGDVDGKG